MPHPAFQYEWPEDMHPKGFVFLHSPFDEVRSTCTFDDKQINALSKHIFDDLGAVLPEFEPSQQSVTVTIPQAGVGKDFKLAVEGVKMTVEVTAPVRIIAGSLPPGLSLVDGVIVGEPKQSGRWKVDLQVGPQYHYQGPLNDGPIGSYNRGSWVDVRTPIKFPTPLDGLEDVDEDQVTDGLRQLPDDKLAALRAGLARLDAEENGDQK